MGSKIEQNLDFAQFAVRAPTHPPFPRSSRVPPPAPFYLQIATEAHGNLTAGGLFDVIGPAPRLRAVHCAAPIPFPPISSSAIQSRP